MPSLQVTIRFAQRTPSEVPSYEDTTILLADAPRTSRTLGENLEEPVSPVPPSSISQDCIVRPPLYRSGFASPSPIALGI
ncbi:unnamed protein product [Fusarium graminearum]|uniref:Uncharacterized protein n=1 Tax=Gibberella zeae TaxID=5518 RepID=A0A679NT18_GIBZA|nr:unnamed protein product [Fusarium graminearum]CAG1966637.1 unnamed protein product [Fusarium graminearum]CAG1978605.1 unnamed protein product [Fusarium graminearum]CZS77004.1 unnamed protein product [Fusarium graminearum]